MNQPTDPDADLDAYYENIAHNVHAGLYDRPHRCPPDVPPCPDCQAIEELEDNREYGDH